MFQIKKESVNGRNFWEILKRIIGKIEHNRLRPVCPVLVNKQAFMRNIKSSRYLQLVQPAKSYVHCGRY